jgi:replicative DNA helicase
MLNLCLKALDNNIQCAIFSTEMPAKEIHIRAAANIAKVESRKIERASPDIVEQVTDVV